MVLCFFVYIISAKKGLNPQLQDGTLSGDDDGADGNDGTGRGLDQCDAYWVSETVPLQCAAAGRNTGKDYVIFRKDVNTCMTPS